MNNIQNGAGISKVNLRNIGYKIFTYSNLI